MHKRDGSSVVFGCFSPPVMVATFLIEMGGALYVLWRYKLSRVSQLIIALLVNLALFQLAEYFVCVETPFALTASRFGYAAITLLPVLGLHLMSELTRPIRGYVLKSLYVVAALIVVYFLSRPDAFNAYECTGNYVIFQIGQLQTYVYSVYYFGLLAAALWVGSRHVLRTGAKQARPALWLLLGYLVFITPVAVLTIVHPDTRHAIPSVLCGFAVSLAVILIAKVAPLTLVTKR